MKTRVLVVDDDKTVRETIKKGLSITQSVSESLDLSKKKAELFGKLSEHRENPFMPEENFEVLLSASGEHGAEQVRKSIEANNPFQLVFLDIRMPGMSGDKCARKIRSMDADIGICFITGYSDRDASALVRKTGGATDKILFLKKPFEYDEIRQIARAFSAKWYAERKAVAFQNSLKNVIYSILSLKDIPLENLRKLLQTTLFQVLSFIGAESGFIGRLSVSGRLQFEIGFGKFESEEDITGLYLPDDIFGLMNSGKDFIIKRISDNVVIPMVAMEYQRVVVAVDKGKLVEENKYFIRLFTENAAVALANAALFLELKTAKETLEVKVKDRTIELEDANERLKDMAIKDSLTGIYNRRYLEEVLNNEVALAKKNNSDIILMMIDIDYFKSINDRYGHYEGDNILISLAALLTNNLTDTDIISRYGGDEFVIIFHNIQLEDAYTIAKRMSHLYKELPIKEKYQDISLALSIGIASFNSDIYYIKNGMDLFKKADEALYMAKRNGRDRVEVWKPLEELFAPQPKILWKKIDTLMDRLSNLSSKTKKDYTDELSSIISVIESKDIYTANHSKNVAYYTRELLVHLNLEKKYIDEIHVASILHDIGKIGIPDNILQKEEPLSEEDWKIIRNHPLLGVKILRQSKFMGKEVLIVKHHHERFDGTGYPDGLKKQYIPYGSRIINIADSFDAMTNTRPYRHDMNVDAIMSEMKRCAGIQFDPELLEVFFDVVEKNRDLWPVKGVATKEDTTE